MYPLAHSMRAFESPVFAGRGAFQSPATYQGNYNQDWTNVGQGNFNRQSMFVNNQDGWIDGPIHQNQGIYNDSSIYNTDHLYNSYDYQPSYGGYGGQSDWSGYGGAFQSPVFYQNNLNSDFYNVNQGNGNHQSMFVNNQGGHISGGIHQGQYIDNYSYINDQDYMANNYDYQQGGYGQFDNWGGADYQQWAEPMNLAYVNYSPVNINLNYTRNVTNNYHQTINNNITNNRHRTINNNTTNNHYRTINNNITNNRHRTINNNTTNNHYRTINNNTTNNPTSPPVEVSPPPPSVDLPPPPSLTPKMETARLWGDPHLVGADGGKYGVQELGYHNIVTDGNFKVIGNFAPTRKDKSFMAESGVVFGNNRLKITPDGNIVYNNAEQQWGENNQMTLDGFGTLRRKGKNIDFSANGYNLAYELKKDHLDLDISRDVAGIMAGREDSPTGLLGETFDADSDKQKKTEARTPSIYNG